MKRVYLLLTLFIASFFFVTNVHAATYTAELSEDTMSLINDDFFDFRDKIINYVEVNGYSGYIIGRDGAYYAYLLSEGSSFAIKDTPGSSSVLTVYRDKLSFARLIDNEIKVVLSSNSGNDPLMYQDVQYFNIFLDSSSPIIHTGIYNNVHNLNYKNITYTIKRQSIVPSVYDIYLEHNVPDEPVDNFLEEKEMMNNFYFTIFTKIDELVTKLANNYIFLLIFGIFILIFIFEIIRRRII